VPAPFVPETNRFERLYQVPFFFQCAIESCRTSNVVGRTQSTRRKKNLDVLTTDMDLSTTADMLHEWDEFNNALDDTSTVNAAPSPSRRHSTQKKILRLDIRKTIRSIENIDDAETLAKIRDNATLDPALVAERFRLRNQLKSLYMKMDDLDDVSSTPDAAGSALSPRKDGRRRKEPPQRSDRAPWNPQPTTSQSHQTPTRQPPPSPVSSPSPSVDKIVSPIAIDASPIQRYELKESAVRRILKWGNRICRNQIGLDYLREKASKSNSEIWTVADSRGNIFAFAITEFGTVYVTLHLICSIKRKGEGMRLFDKILDYCQRIDRGLSLHPIDKKVAGRYVGAAHRRGMVVSYETPGGGYTQLQQRGKFTIPFSRNGKYHAPELRIVDARYASE
jgi:hypothetical protein